MRRKQSRTPPDRRQFALAAVVMVVLTLWLYAPVRHYAFLNWDDDLYVSENVVVQQGLTAEALAWSFNIGYAGNWHPLTWWSHMLDWQLFGDRAGAHHLTNVLLHVCVAVALLVLLMQLRFPPLYCVLGAALFAWHPQRVESVAWVAERKDLLCGLFSVLALIFYVRFGRSRNSGGGWGWYAGAVAALALALLSKGMAVTIPCVMLLLDAGPLERIKRLDDHRQWRALLIEKLPLFALVIGACVLTFCAQRELAVVSVRELPPGTRALTAVVAYGFYVSRFLVPAQLAIPYPYPESWSAVAIVTGLLLLAAGSWLTWRRFAHDRLPALGWAWFLGMLVPVIGIIQVGHQAYADRYTYLPAIGLVLITLAQASRDCLEKSRAASGMLWLGSLLVLSRQQLCHWQNSETLFRHSVAVTEGNVLALANLGQELNRQQRYAEAKAILLEATALSPGHLEATSNLGTALVSLGELDAAVHQLQTALSLHPQHDDLRNNLAVALATRGQADQAEQILRHGLDESRDAERPYNLAILLTQRGNYEQALAYYDLSLQRRPGRPKVLLARADCLLAAGRPQESLNAYRALIAREPGMATAYQNYAVALSRTGHEAEAIAACRQGLRLNPGEPRCWGFLARRLLKQRPYPAAEAIAAARQAVLLSGGNSPAHLATLAKALGMAGQVDEAISTVDRALQLAPESQDLRTLRRALTSRAGP